MIYTQLFDMQVIADTICHPRIYPHVSDDLAPPRESFVPCEHPSLYYLGAWDDSSPKSGLSGLSGLSGNPPNSPSGEYLGLWMFAPQNSICWEVHTCLLPSAWGKRAAEATLGAVNHIWTNTPCCRIITTVPTYNTLATRLAEKAGMTRYGVNPRSFLKNGLLSDQILLGISKPEQNTCH